MPRKEAPPINMSHGRPQAVAIKMQQPRKKKKKNKAAMNLISTGQKKKKKKKKRREINQSTAFLSQ